MSQLKTLESGHLERVIVKVGTNVITTESGELNQERMLNLVQQLVALKRQGIQVLLVSSGAVAAGKSMQPDLVVEDDDEDVIKKQLWSSIGQPQLMTLYGHLFNIFNVQPLQVLLQKSNFSNGTEHLRNVLEGSLSNEDLIPIVNENDAVAVYELLFTDNDELAGEVAKMIRAQVVFLLTSRDGIFDGDPDASHSRLISHIDAGTFKLADLHVAKGTSNGRGGITSKCRVALDMAQHGIKVVIANGMRENIIGRVLQGEADYTLVS